MSAQNISFADQEKGMQVVAELEIEMMADMYKRMTNACRSKCVSSRYREAELTKGEAVCLDRCVAKYLDIHEKVGKKLTEITQAEQVAAGAQTSNIN